MDIQQAEPRFNLGYVVRETNIKPDTLRAWERRYGLPLPERTDGGHRLYSQRDMDIVRWLMAQQEEGLSISKAVSLWNSLEARGKDPLLNETNENILSEETPAIYRAVHETSLDEMRQGWIQACLRFDNAVAQGVLSRAFANYPMKDVLYQVLQRGLAEIGVHWFEKKATIQQEHFASALALQRLHALIADAPPPTLNGKVLIGGAIDEAHEFAPLMVNLLLRYRGWEVVYLGPNVPALQLEITLQKTRAQLVVLTAEQLHTAANLLDQAVFLKDLHVQLGYGGAIFNHLPKIRQRIPGHFLGANIEDAVAVIEDVLVRHPLTPSFTALSVEYRDALAFFREKQSLIEGDIGWTWEGSGLSAERMRLTHQRLSQSIDAALRLGDIHYVDREIDWAEGLIANYAYERGTMHYFLRGYEQALRKHMDARGQLILDWMVEAMKGN
ncbi:MAG: MerR family transcriptional regulator [Anaerolineaceae bacterium]|jgi:DNA-binding transcriptional MerR regulator|nr:MerR family transcriptional regulator [Anaerolineaceae bacterium]